MQYNAVELMESALGKAFLALLEGEAYLRAACYSKKVDDIQEHERVCSKWVAAREEIEKALIARHALPSANIPRHRQTDMFDDSEL